MPLFTRDDYSKVLETSPIKGQDEPILKALRYINLGYPVMFYGPAGNGKSTVASHILSYLGKEWLKIEATEGMTEYHVIGGFHPLSMSADAERSKEFLYKDGVVSRAMLEGKNLLIDEFTRAPSSAYSGLFLLLSFGELPLEYRQQVIKKPPDWVLIATANFGDDGTFKLSSALKRRFIPIGIGYPKRYTEEKLLKEVVPGLPEEIVRAILDFAEGTREMWRKDKTLPSGLSTDGVIKMARYCHLSIQEGTDKQTAFTDSALHQGVIIADETDYLSLQTVQELALTIAKKMGR
ncbi:MAG: MoxR family ATPase [Euryarchaeota archaeon]|nr:MoxR family ATPase [Euryarchaeota archaeon]